MKHSRFEIELFSITNVFDIDNVIRKENVGNRTGNALVIGKQLLMSPFVSGIKHDYQNYTKHPFRCDFDIPFDVEVTLSSGKNRILNTEVYYTDYLNGNEVEFKAYTYLTCTQIFSVKWKRKLCWIQQSSNIMWLINVLVALMAVFATYITAKDKLDQRTINPNPKIEKSYPK